MAMVKILPLGARLGTSLTCKFKPLLRASLTNGTTARWRTGNTMAPTTLLTVPLSMIGVTSPRSSGRRPPSAVALLSCAPVVPSSVSTAGTPSATTIPQVSRLEIHYSTKYKMLIESSGNFGGEYASNVLEPMGMSIESV